MATDYDAPRRNENDDVSEDSLEELASPRLLGLRQHLAWWAGFEYDAAFDEQHLIGHLLGEADLVRDDDHRPVLLGEVAPGGVGTGLYGILMMAVVTVFVGGLLVGRSPEFLGKKIGQNEITMAALYVLVMPALVLVGVGISVAMSSTLDAQGNSGAPGTPGSIHGFSEVIYAYASAANNNGSAFGGLTVTSDFFQITLGLAMLLGRLVPIVLVLLLAGSLAEQGKVPVTAGTLPTHKPLFVGLMVGVIVIMTALTYFPALALGPIAEALA